MSLLIAVTLAYLAGRCHEDRGMLVVAAGFATLCALGVIT